MESTFKYPKKKECNESPEVEEDSGTPVDPGEPGEPGEGGEDPEEGGEGGEAE